MADVLAQWDAHVARLPTTAATEAPPPIWVDDDDWDEAAIPQRPWVVPGYLMRGAVTIAAGPGAAGKSSLVCGWAVACALGRDLGQFRPPTPCTVMLYSVEDDARELQRRLSAAMRRHAVRPRDLKGRVIRTGPSGVGTLIERNMLGEFTATAAWAALEALIIQRKPDVIVLDPLVELHTAEENDNTAIRLVVAHLRSLAHRHNVAILLIHHTRKGATAGDVEAIRGAGSLVGAVRAAFTVNPMAEEEAEELGIAAASRRSFVRVDAVKQNYAAAREADWHELVEYELDNGEMIAGIVPWQPPRPAETPPEARAAIEADLARGSDGGPYSPRLAHDQARSAAPLLARHGITGAGAQKKFLSQLLAAGWSVSRFRDGNGDARNGLRSPEGMPEVKWI